MAVTVSFQKFKTESHTYFFVDVPRCHRIIYTVFDLISEQSANLLVKLKKKKNLKKNVIFFLNIRPNKRTLNARPRVAPSVG